MSSLAITTRQLPAYDPMKQAYLKEYAPLAVITLAEEASLGHARLGHIYVHSCSFKPFLQLHCCQLIIQFGVGVCCEVTVDTSLPSAAEKVTHRIQRSDLLCC